MKRAYSWRYDAFFSIDNNQWTEEKCGDEGCDVCPSRPDRPLDDTSKHWDELPVTEENK
jgi:hypothetical protein